jgi:hypothetical protein
LETLADVELKTALLQSFLVGFSWKNWYKALHSPYVCQLCPWHIRLHRKYLAEDESVFLAYTASPIFVDVVRVRSWIVWIIIRIRARVRLFPPLLASLEAVFEPFRREWRSICHCFSRNLLLWDIRSPLPTLDVNYQVPDLFSFDTRR